MKIILYNSSPFSLLNCKKSILFIFFLFTLCGFSQTSITINNPIHPESYYTPEQLIKDVLIGAGDLFRRSYKGF